MAIRSIQTHHVSYKIRYVPSNTIRIKQTVMDHEQSEKWRSGTTVAE